MKKNTVSNKSSREIAESLGLSPSDALEWEIRNLITNQIIKRSKLSALSITEIAKRSGTSRSRITKILKNDSFGISLDVLIRVLGALGEKVKLSFSKAA